MPAPAQRSGLSVAWSVAAFLSALPVVIAVMHKQSVLVSSVPEQESLDFGWPFAWITQDQTASDPPMPHQASFASPWERPFDVHWLALGLDVLLVGLAFLAVIQAGWAIAQRLQRSHLEADSPSALARDRGSLGTRTRRQSP